MQKKIHEKAISSLTRYKESHKMIETLKILFNRDLNRLKSEIGFTTMKMIYGKFKRNN
jgi:hypothetical protein